MFHKPFTRRRFLTTSLAAAAATRVAQAESNLPSLKQLARDRGIRFGSDSDTRFADAPTAYSQLFADQCDLFAPLMSWSYINPTPDSAIHDDPNLAFVRQHKLQLTGGHLLWYKRTPDWLTPLSNKDAEAAILTHIQQVADRYGDILYSWNVVNEAINDNADGGNMRPSVLNDKFSLDYFEFAAHKAKEVAPHLPRVYNDYGFENNTPQAELKRKRLLDLLDHFRKKNIPIDAVGLQSHIRLGAKSPYDEQVTVKFLKEISDRGFKIFITELDVFDIDTPSPIATRDQLVADRYSRYLDAALANPATTTLVLWGLSDKYTWLTPKFNPKYARADGAPSRPCPFDADLQPKLAFKAICEALRNTTSR